MLKLFFIFLFFVTHLVLVASEIAIRGKAAGNCWTQGEVVSFSSKEKIENDGMLLVRVFDAENTKVVENELSVSAFNQDGWQWKTDAIGFYTVFFVLNGQVLEESYDVEYRVPHPSIPGKYIKKKDIVTHDCHSFCIVPKSSSSSVQNNSIGLSLSLLDGKEIEFGRKLGITSILVNDVQWSDIELEQGEYHWETVDSFLQLAQHYGISCNNITVAITGTPRWASSNPEANRRKGNFVEYMGFPPKQNEDFALFLAVFSKKYPQIQKYHIWQHPDYAGKTVTWSGNAREFGQLAQAGYQAVKDSASKASVSIGSFNEENEDFFEEMLSLSGYKPFDVLAIEGDMNQNLPFFYAKTAKACGENQKQFINIDWEPLKAKKNMDVNKSEINLGRALILDYVAQIKNGVSALYLPGLLNPLSGERENMQLLQKAGNRVVNSTGLFRRMPYPEPRYSSFSLCLFTNIIGTEFTVLNEYVMTSPEGLPICIVQLKIKNGKSALLIWNPGDDIATPNESILQVAGSKVQTICSSGYRIDLSNSTKLLPDFYYLLTDLENSSFTKWNKFRANAIACSDALGEKAICYEGVFRPSAIMSPDGLFPVEAKSLRSVPMPWSTQNDEGTNIIENGGDGFALGITKKQDVELIIAINTDEYTPDSSSLEQAKQNCFLAVSFDFAGKALASDVTRFVITRDKEYNAVVYKDCAPLTTSDQNGAVTPAGEICQDINARIVREGNFTYFYLKIPAAEFQPFLPNIYSPVRMGIVAGKKSDDGQMEYFGWGYKPSDLFSPCYFGTLVPNGEKAEIIQNSLNFDLQQSSNTENGIIRKIDHSGDYIHVNSSSTGLLTQEIKLAGAHTYKIRFKARGNASVAINKQCVGEVPGTLFTLNDLNSVEWNDYEFTYQASEKVSSWNLIFKTENKTDRFFDIKDFIVTIK